MKELQAYQVIRRILQKQDTCTYKDIADYKTEFEKSNPEVYVCFTRDDIYYAQESFKDEFFWEEKLQAFIQQELIICPCCKKTYYKYPNSALFEEIQNFKEKYEKLLMS